MFFSISNLSLLYYSNFLSECEKIVTSGSFDGAMVAPVSMYTHTEITSDHKAFSTASVRSAEQPC
jgi:hypothetical protein